MLIAATPHHFKLSIGDAQRVQGELLSRTYESHTAMSAQSCRRLGPNLVRCEWQAFSFGQPPPAVTVYAARASRSCIAAWRGPRRPRRPFEECVPGR